MAKKSFYLKFEDIPEADRADYSLKDGKYVLDLDGQHPVQSKNTELLAEKSQRDATMQTAISAAVSAKDAEISRLSSELTTAKAANGLPAGQAAVPVEDLTTLNQFKALGEFKDVKAKVDEYGTLKEQTEAQTRKALLTNAAKAHGIDPDAFILLAEPEKLAEKLEMREVPDPKKPAEKVKHFFVKQKDAAGAETATVLGDFVKTDDKYKPFLGSLFPAQSGDKTRRIPEQGVGDPPSETPAGRAYIGRMYKRPDEKKDV